jgi:DNA-binding NarL/FixJ family response regulator
MTWQERGNPERIERLRSGQLVQGVRTAVAGADSSGATALAACASWPEFEALGLLTTLRGEVLGRGHKLRLLLHRSVLSTQASDRPLRRLADLGADIRVTRWALPNMLVLGSEVITATEPGGAESEGVHVHSGGLGTVMRQLFGALWDHAGGLATARRAEAIHTSPVRSTVLAYLSTGILDDAAAREMAISVRTYRRYVAGILHDLDVGSRFQAGARAAELGLLGE